MKQINKASIPGYTSWQKMKERCLSKSGIHFRNYGGRGITVCERWASFDNFIQDMGPRPSQQHSLERKDNDAGYFPENCTWATRTEQANNRRTNHLLEHDGQTHTISEWAKIVGISRRVIRQRIAKLNMPASEALTRPVRFKAKVTKH